MDVKKDIEWLKEEVKKVKLIDEPHELNKIYYDEVLELIDQLDETSILFQMNLVERLKDEACLIKEPSLQPSIKALGELHIKNGREIDWKLNDIEQWEEEIKKARAFVEVLEERNTSIKYAVKVLEGAEDERGSTDRGEDANDCAD